MKKIIIYSTFFCAALVACTEKKEANTNLAKYEKNLAIAKQFYEAFTSKDSVNEETLLADDLKWNGPAIGQDSLSKDQYLTNLCVSSIFHLLSSKLQCISLYLLTCHLLI